jgi:thiamine biosynthesis protein ThiI
VRNPQGIISVEIREKAYIYGNSRRGLQGLPVGTAGRGLLLLSGGIDSPVAGFMMASRGMGIDAVYFHAWPYTSEEARQKVVRLAEIAGQYTLGIRLFTVGFTPVQKRIKERAPLPWTTVLLRMAMMECAEKIARKIKAKCLITGESLSQVASQTIENIRCTQSRIGIPVLQPLIGMDKESIIRKAETIGTYGTSILPYEDCCVLFSPPHPILRGDPEEAARLYEALELDPLIHQAITEAVTEKCGFPEEG